jgi:hypothetical protein
VRNLKKSAPICSLQVFHASNSALQTERSLRIRLTILFLSVEPHASRKFNRSCPTSSTANSSVSESTQTKQSRMEPPYKLRCSPTNQTTKNNRYNSKMLFHSHLAQTFQVVRCLSSLTETHRSHAEALRRTKRSETTRRSAASWFTKAKKSSTRTTISLGSSH